METDGIDRHAQAMTGDTNAKHTMLHAAWPKMVDDKEEERQYEDIVEKRARTQILKVTIEMRRRLFTL